MQRELKVGDKVHTPCTNFNDGQTYFEEREVKEIGEDFIVLNHVATLRKNGEQLRRTEVFSSDIREGKQTRDYYSRPLQEILEKYHAENEWLLKRIEDDTLKYS